MNHNQIPGGDPDQRPGDQNNNRNGKGPKNGQTILIFLVISLVVLLLVNFMNGILKDSTEKEITYNQFMKMLKTEKWITWSSSPARSRSHRKTSLSLG